MTTDNLVTIFTTLAFGPGVAIVLLRWVLGRATAQDTLLANQSSRLETQAGQIAKLQTRVDELEGEGRQALTQRLEASIAEESRLVESIDRISQQAVRLAAAVDALERGLSLRTCQLPGPLLAQVQEWIRQHVRAEVNP